MKMSEMMDWREWKAWCVITNWNLSSVYVMFWTIFVWVECF